MLHKHHSVLIRNQHLAFAAVLCMIDNVSLLAQVSALMRQVLSELAEGAGRQRAKLLLDAFKQTDERRRAQLAEVTPTYILISAATAHGRDRHSSVTSDRMLVSESQTCLHVQRVDSQGIFLP